jgi:hypothetical protein
MDLFDLNLGLEPDHEASGHAGKRELLQFAQKAYWDGASFFFMSVGFYFASLAFLIGYIASQKPNPDVATVTLYVGIAVSLLALIVAVVFARGLLSCVDLIENLVIQSFPSEKVLLKDFFIGWRRLVKRTRRVGYALIVLFMVAIFLLLRASTTAVHETPTDFRSILH